MYKETSNALFTFISSCPTASHTVDTAVRLLKKSGYTQLFEEGTWALKPGGKFFLTRGMTTLVAFQLPRTDYSSFLIAASHSDSPGFKVKAQPKLDTDKTYARLNTETYGGINLRLWMDRPLSVAGRVAVHTHGGVELRLLNIDRDLLIIPSLAMHMDREASNDGALNPQVDSLPLYGPENADFMALIAEAAKTDPADILSYDLHLYCRQPGILFGDSNEFIASPRLDNLQSVYTSLQAFLAAENPAHVPVLAVLDSEEVGSQSKQGADSTILSDTLHRIGMCCGKPQEKIAASIAGSFIMSVDNGHAMHPNHPERSDLTNHCRLNGGIVIKHSPRYATDCASAAVVKHLCGMAGVPYQIYYNRSDIPGGSTIGNISATHVSAHTADIGLAQLSMHSPYETGGAMDTEYMRQLLTVFFSSSITMLDGGTRFNIHDKPKAANASLWQDISSFSGQFSK